MMLGVLRDTASFPLTSFSFSISFESVKTLWSSWRKSNKSMKRWNYFRSYRKVLNSIFLGSRTEIQCKLSNQTKYSFKIHRRFYCLCFLDDDSDANNNLLKRISDQNNLHLNLEQFSFGAFEIFVFRSILFVFVLPSSQIWNFKREHQTMDCWKEWENFLEQRSK